MRSTVWIALAAVACAHSCAPPPSPSVAPPPPVTAPVRGTAVPTSAASAAPTPLPAPEWLCDEGVTVDVAKVDNKIEGSFSRFGVREMIGWMSCEPYGWARILARRDESGVFKMARAESLIGAHEVIADCQVLPTSDGRDLPICRRSWVSYGEVFDGVVVLDYTKDMGDEAVPLVGVIDTTDMACQGKTDLAVGELMKFELVDIDGDGNKDVRVTLRMARFHVPKQPPCKNFGFAGSGQPPPNIPHPPPQTVDFIAHGTVLTPTAAGARVLKMLAKLTPPD
jgi:hypothetical protein